jgi:hypothetical protein
MITIFLQNYFKNHNIGPRTFRMRNLPCGGDAGHPGGGQEKNNRKEEEERHSGSLIQRTLFY